MGFTHFTVDRTLNFVDPNTGSYTQNMERSWKSAKQRNKRHTGTHRTMLDSYVCEWMWRKRNVNNDLYDQILTDISNFWPYITKVNNEYN